MTKRSVTTYPMFVAGPNDAEPVLLLHGFTGSHQSWASAIARLSSQYRVVAPDLPGHGAHPASEDWQALSMERQARALMDALTAWHSCPYTVVGYSMGGRLALTLAVVAPQLVRRLVLESTSPGIEDERERSLRRQSDWQLAAAIEDRGIDWFVDYWCQTPLFRHQSPAVRDQENCIRRQQTPHGLAQSLRGAGVGGQAPLWDRLSSLNIPTLIVVGALDAKYREIGHRMQSAMPQSRLVTINNSGHTCHAEQPQWFIDVVESFLNEDDQPLT